MKKEKKIEIKAGYGKGITIEDMKLSNLWAYLSKLFPRDSKKARRIYDYVVRWSKKV